MRSEIFSSGTVPSANDTRRIIKVKTLQAINNTPPPSGQSGSGSPVGVVTPQFVDQLYTDATGGPAYWRSTGLTNSDWTLIA